MNLIREEDSYRRILGARVPVRAFALELTTNGFTTRGTLTLDAEFRPATIELIFPLGHKIFRRVR